MKTDKPEKYILYFVLIFFTLLLCYPLVYLISQSFSGFVNYIFGPGHINENSSTGKAIFYGAKIASITVVTYVVAAWIDIFTEQKLRFSAFIKNVACAVTRIIRENIEELRFSGRSNAIPLLLILLTQTVAYFYFLCTIPLHYDEWVSYFFFSGKSFWQTMTYYPFPNNHIFYNIVARIFLQLPIDAEISLRLPSFIASIACSYYFFKTCRLYFNSTISCIVLVFTIVSFPVIVFSFAARGYAFVNLFCVLLMYSSTKLSQDFTSIKYRFVFIISIILGLYTIPSFLYVLFIPCSLLAVYLFKQPKNFWLLIKEGLIGFFVVLALYSLIIYFNNPQLLLNPNGGNTKFSFNEPGAIAMIVEHLKATLYFLFHFNSLWVITLCLIANTLYYLFRQKNRSWFLCILSFGMIVSPFVILSVHKVVPFPRTWLYLVFPMAINLGIMLSNLEEFAGKANFYRFKNGFLAFLVSLCIVVFSGFPYKHWAEGPIEYQMNELRQKELLPELGRIKFISGTYVGPEYAISEELQYFCFKDNPERQIRVTSLDSITTQDILLIDKSQLPKFANGLSKYDSLSTIGNTHLFKRKSN